MPTPARQARLFRWSGIVLLSLAALAVPLSVQGYRGYRGPHPELVSEVERTHGFEFQLTQEQIWGYGQFLGAGLVFLGGSLAGSLLLLKGRWTPSPRVFESFRARRKALAAA